MQCFNRIERFLIVAVSLTFAGGKAFGDEGVRLKITNDGIVDIYVTVSDSNLHAPIVEHQRLNGFASLPLTATADDKGYANITWTTISIDNRDKHCGHGADAGLENDATVNVHADSSCST